MPSRLAASTMSAPFMALASPVPCQQVAAVEQDRALVSDIGAQLVDQCLQMGKAAEPAESRRPPSSNSTQVKA